MRQRLANEARLNAVIQQTVISSILSKKGGKALKELLEKLDDGY